MISVKSPGMRTIKTLLVVSICFILSKLLNLDYPFYAVVAGIICTQNTVHGSFDASKNRIIGTIIGSLLGIVFVYLFSYNPWSSGIGVLILLSFLKLTKLEDAYRVACIVYLATFIPGHGPAIAYGIHRTIATIIGIITALIVNLIVAPPQYADEINRCSYDLVNRIIELCGDFFICGNKIDLSLIGSEIFNIESLMKNYNLDVTKSNIKVIDIEIINSLIFDSKKIYYHLGVINELGQSFKLTEENASYISKFYNQELSTGIYEKNCINDVLNYHIKKIITYLDQLKKLSFD